MEMTRNVQIRIGIFLGLGLLAAVVSILALSGQKSLFKSYLRLHAEMPQVQGLAEGSVVSLSGVVVGNIEKIEFASGGNTLRVIMKIDEKFRDRIPKDSTVEIRTQGALGDKFIYITPGSEELRVEEGSLLMASQAQDLMGVLAERGNQAGRIFDVINEVHVLLKSINAENRTEKIMRNFSEASSSLKGAAEETKVLIGELRNQSSGSLASTLKRLDAILAKVERGEGTVGALINDPSLHEQLKAILGANPRKQYIQSILQNSLEKKDSK